MQEQDIEHAETEPIIVPAAGDPGAKRQEEYLVVEDESGSEYLVPPDEPNAPAEKN